MKYYYWLDPEFYYGDFKVPKFALYRMEFSDDTDDGVDRDTEERILWAAYEDLGIEDLTTADYTEIDKYIEEKLGFLPDYDIG